MIELKASCVYEGEASAVKLVKDPSTPALYHLELRAFITDGGEPYALIMDCVRQIETGEVLVLHTPFEPKPLLKQLERMRFSLNSQKVEPDHWTVEIKRS